MLTAVTHSGLDFSYPAFHGVDYRYSRPIKIVPVQHSL